MNLEPGHSIGPYEIVGPLGAGGMGEVYRARDSRLDREVAIKILPQRIAGDADALARFEREAKAVAALSHPNILAIHDFGTHDGTAYAVMELLEGRTLRETLDDGSLPPRKALDLARQIARGLGSAHDGGVVHRDLKPDNLFVSRDGRVKILDFGLARVGDAAGSNRDDRTRTSLTEPGTVMGTVNYMSPEQATAQPVGPASDIFSLGAVLYEMLAGRRPFERETAPETMTAILREDPPEITRAGVSPAALRIVQRCLEKEPSQRFQSAHDLAFALETTSQSSGSGAVPTAMASPPPRVRTALLPPLLAMLALGLVVGALGTSWLRPAPAPPPVKVRSLTFSGFDFDPAASPDGRTIAFTSRRGDVAGIWVKPLAGGGDVPLTDGQDALPRFSPDGSTLLFTRTEGGRPSIFRVPLVGGSPRKLIDNAFEADWSPDGSQVVFVRGGFGSAARLGIANADGSGERIAVTGDSETVRVWHSPRWSPDGRTVALVERTSSNNLPKRILLFDLDTEELRDLPPERPTLSGLAWSGSGHDLLFAWSDDLLSGQASTAARMVLQDVRSGVTRDLFWASYMLNVQNGTDLDIVADGTVVFGSLALMQNLTQVEVRDGASVEARTLTSGNSVDRQPCLGPDGETVLFASNRTGSLDLWTLNRRSGAEQQLTDDTARDWDPGFIPGGGEIVWSSDRSGNLEIWLANADGSGARQVTRDGVDAENPTATPDGDWIVYMTSNPAHPGLWKIRRDGSDATHLWQGSGFVPELSPDGRYAAFASAGERYNAVNVVDVESGETVPFRIRVPQMSDGSAGGLGRSRWFDDGRALAFTGADGDRVGVFAQDFDPQVDDTSATRRRLAGFDPEWNTESFDISNDGRVVILSRVRPGGTVMLAENVPFVVGRAGAR